MTSAKKKKSPARKRGIASKIAAFGLFRIKRFVLSAGASALASFQIVSCSFDPASSAEKLLNQALATLHIPSLNLPSVDIASLQIPALSSISDTLSAFRKNGWPNFDGDGTANSPPGKVARTDASTSGGSTSFANCSQFFPGGKAPTLQLQQRERELCFSSFAVLHNGATKTPVFVAQRLNRRLLEQAQGLKRTDKFYADARLPFADRSQLDDYKHSGYSRGHMAPAADMSTPEAMAQSFSLANMVPQNQIHNAGAWSQVEQATRKYALRAKGDVYVFTGPVFTQNAAAIGPGKVAVPDYIFKLVYDASTRKSWVHWQANSPDARMGSPISYEEFTRRTGMPLLSGA
ncbi:DNA/RNA non-specific endonuclease [Comamonas sp. Y33R10-2]|uniref:DNA/RNA non-specific endonuclease n=1 Tax=Comamonas sp. Y33R10-2 TaxID=2853257 RepID=UPI001C5C87E8|nr:DNA/RNA non-specific endonuclease [Comamonas sp. Y33R10-2]QXZ09610.1 DNA/RNA non-specific endonuclease [Comamonas sp. Y33R10-2]